MEAVLLLPCVQLVLSAGRQLGPYAISFNIYNNPTWARDTLSWDISEVEEDLSPRQDLRFGYRGNSTTFVPKYLLHTMLAAVTVKLVSNLLGLLACLCSLLASLCKHDKLLLPLLAWIPLDFAVNISISLFKLLPLQL